MISCLQGKVIFKGEKFIILDVRGVGYKVFLSQKTLSKIPQNKESLKVFCHLILRQNALDLCGFPNLGELKFFEMLLSIPGIGPKAALEISSLGPLEKLKEKILAQDEKIFEEISLIGKKKARSIILELSGKIKEISKKRIKKTDEVEEALVNLGFPRQRVKEVISRIPKDIQDTEQKIKKALKILGRR
ncbi:Holliday junction branch migration protein RuvA [Patescibacteria group bacterium]|nr:Holliday junction branch migration protein RuvA [Patescibacteria group bacterium]